jgi:DNA-binding NtrC family response regulator
MARVLVIDDSEEVRGMLRDALEAAGHEVSEAAEGEAGLRLLRQAPQDVVVLDMFMEGKEGLSTMQELRREFPDLPVIGISGGGDVGPFDPLVLARRLGAARTLSKPFPIEQLLEAVAELSRR